MHIAVSSYSFSQAMGDGRMSIMDVRYVVQFVTPPGTKSALG